MDIRATTKFFFTEDSVKRLIDKKTRKALSKIGAFVRQRAKSSIKYREGHSAPGQPPHAHKGRFSRKNKGGKAKPFSPLRDLIFFAAAGGTNGRLSITSSSNQSVVVGPVEFTATRNKSYLIPQVLEQGGFISSLVGGRREQHRYEPRPFMKPALDAEVKAGTVVKAFAEQE